MVVWFRVCSGLASNACSLVAGRFPRTELYAGFWDVLKLGGISIGFEKFFV